MRAARTALVDAALVDSEPSGAGRGDVVAAKRPVAQGPWLASGADRQSERMRWAAHARRRELESALTEIWRPGVLGVVVTGPPGVGKSFLASGIVAALGPETHVQHVHASTAPSSGAYSALGFLLARVAPAYLESPLGILLGVDELVRRDAAGRQTVLLVDTSAPLDEESTGVIAHLLHDGTAKLVAVAPRPADLPTDLGRLVREGKLRTIQLGTLTPLLTRELLLTLLGGIVSLSAVSSLYEACAGHVLALPTIVRGQIERGNLVSRRGVWTLRGPIESPTSSGADELLRARWAKEPRDVREVIELLADARRVPLTTLAGVFGVNVIVHMEDAGLVRIDATAQRGVALAEPRMADIVRERLTQERRRRLRDMLDQGTTPEPCEAPGDLVAYADWSLDSGAGIGGDLLASAAGAAISLADPERALRFAGLVPADHTAAPEALLHRAEALAQLGRLEEALEALDSIPGDSGGPVGAARRVLLRCRILRWLPGREDPLDAIAAVRSELAASSREAPEASEALELLERAEFEQRCFTGSYRGLADRLRSSWRGHGGSAAFRAACGFMLADVWSATGRADDAVALAESLVQSGPRGVLGAFDSGYAVLLEACLLAGQWWRCHDVAGLFAGSGSSQLRLHGGDVEIGQGLAHLLAGHGERALEPLLAGTVHLEDAGFGGRLSLAYAATALAFAQLGDGPEARGYLDRAAAADRSPSWRVAWAADFCTALAKRWLGDPEAAGLLRALAAEEEAAGRYTTACLALFEATVREDDGLGHVEALARHTGSRFTRLLGAVARGRRLCDPDALLAAADDAAALRLEGIEAQAAAQAVDVARDLGRPGAAALAQSRLDALAERLPSLPLVPRTPALSLTAREREVAALAARGASNREIADSMGVSVRTVEGHLYQIFTKLGISSRAGLAGLI
ncbi:helix-turn-helix domain-containing protein [Sinomonas mesophila]|uniref:helix-turn-helix domain-containing protein n=1 Tax=Sinomonas mesophila TaxID=1531955 RepID=UPI001C37CDBF|nr:helix-turn-helix transcriptional regulator [Sinomonas mesophila]